ncbi:hypothetical protein F5B20DRAFT_531525 [Whalleya microplaca]|nr:hypothetical protein F5B20DRAFT_531525 [Whalleya microplaca]
MDKITVRTLYRSVKVGHVVIMISTSIVLLCSLLPIFTSNLFTVQMTNTSTPITLQPVQWLTFNRSELQQSQIADLVLNANLSYPAWTFEDLVIPEHRLRDLEMANDIQPDSTITGNLRAVRAALNCEYSSSVNNVSINIDGKTTTCQPSGLIVCPMDANQPFGLDPIDVRWLCNMVNLTGGWPPLMYAWGKCQEGLDVPGSWGPGSRATVLVCNETFEEVQIQVTLFGPKLEMRESHPPVPIEASRNPITLDFTEPVYLADVPGYNIPYPYGNLVGQQGQAGLFGTLTSSRYAIPNEWLSDDSRKEDVVAAIKKVHGIVRAQMLHESKGMWQYFENSSATASFVTPPGPPSRGEAWQVSSRVMQDATATYVLVCLLGVIFILNALVVWLSEVHGYRRAVPNSPGTIVTVASLFANSTIFDHLPSNAQWTTHQKLEKHFETTRFQMGWFSDANMNGRPIFAIGLVDGETLA